MAKRIGARRARWIRLYTGIYLAGVLVYVAIMLHYKRSLIWSPDGVKQHFTALGYVGRVVRDLLAGKGYRMFNFSLGQGMDVLTTLSYYGYTDPISLLAALFPQERLVLAYIIIGFLRTYLTGLVMGCYARKAGAEDAWGVACAAAIYVFGGYCVYMMGRHPYFINGALYLPLLLLGVERVLQDGRWLDYVLAAALMLIVNFYFAYMNTVIAVVYILVRLAVRWRQRGLPGTAKDGFTLLGGYLLGAALAGVVFVPVAALFLGSSRAGTVTGYRGSMLHYDKSFYLAQIVGAFAPCVKGTQRYTFTGFAPLALFGLLALPGRRDRRSRQVLAGIALCGAAMCVPLMGRVMNGMAYVTNRWSYALAMFVALGCAFGLPRLLGRRERCVRCAVAGLVIAALLMALGVLRREKRTLIGAVAILAYAAVLLAYGRGPLKRLSRGRMRRLMSLSLVGTTVVYIAMVFLPWGNGVILAQAKLNLGEQIGKYAAASQIDDPDVYRVAYDAYDDTAAVLLDYMGTGFYWSLVSGDITDYYLGLGVPGLTASGWMKSLDGDPALTALSAVKYYAASEGSERVAPYGFAPAGELRQGGDVMNYSENTCALPLGYAFDRRMSAEDYEALSMEDRRQALMQFAVCDAPVGVPEGVFSGAAQEVPFEIETAEGVQWEDGLLKVRKGGSMHLAFQTPEDSVSYLILSGLDLNFRNTSMQGGVGVATDNGIVSCVVRDRNNNFYYGMRDYALCLGSTPVDGGILAFQRRSEGVLEDMRIVSIPLSGYREAAEARRAEGMTDVVLGDDRISGRIDVAGERVLQVAVPYSAGWRAWVDGEERPVFRCGGMYMGLALEAGEHEIEMRYVTPGLKLGAAASLAAALAIIALLAAGARRRIRAKKEAA